MFAILLGEMSRAFCLRPLWCGILPILYKDYGILLCEDLFEMCIYAHIQREGIKLEARVGGRPELSNALFVKWTLQCMWLAVEKKDLTQAYQMESR